jgi:hypothetical protein
MELLLTRSLVAAYEASTEQSDATVDHTNATKDDTLHDDAMKLPEEDHTGQISHLGRYIDLGHCEDELYDKDWCEAKLNTSILAERPVPSLVYWHNKISPRHASRER